MNSDKFLKLRGCLIIIGISLMVMGGYIVFNRSTGTENFLGAGFDLKNIAILCCLTGYITVTAFTFRLRILLVCSMLIVILAMTIGSFGGGSMGSWGWTINFITILVIAPFVILLGIIAGGASLMKIISDFKPAQKTVFITGSITIAFCLVLYFLINVKPGLNKAAALLNNKDPYIRIAAAKTLADVCDKRAIDPLIEMLSDPDDKIRASAAELMGHYILAGMNSDTRSIKPLIKSLEDKNANVRAAAAISLGFITEHLNSKAAEWPVTPLKKALKDEDPAVREAAQKALTRILVQDQGGRKI